MNSIEYELVIQAQDGNEDAIKNIYDKFKPIIVKKSKNTFFSISKHGVDIDDIIQEGYIGLDEAIKNYSQDEATTFYTFAMICIERQIANYIRKVSGQKDKILNEAIMIDDVMEKLLSDNTDIEKAITGTEYKIEVINCVKNSLTDLENSVLDLRLKDYSLDEIAKILCKNKKSIYNALQRIKVKFKDFIKNDD